VAEIQKFSERVIDFAERLSDVADAAEGKGRRRAGGGNGTTRWVLLPAAGAGLYALAKSGFLARQTKEIVKEAKARASDLPNDLLNAVRQTQESPSRNGGQGRRKPSSSRASSPRKSKSARSGS
jgi:hypothetical protein